MTLSDSWNLEVNLTNSPWTLMFSCRPLAKANTVAAAAPVMIIFMMNHKPCKLGRTDLSKYKRHQGAQKSTLNNCEKNTQQT